MASFVFFLSCAIALEVVQFVLESPAVITMARFLMAAIMLPFFFVFSVQQEDDSLWLSKYVSKLERRIHNLEEPTWKISRSVDRWSRCNQAIECQCDSMTKHVHCQVEGCLDNQMHVPFDAEIIDLRDGDLKALSNKAFQHFPRLEEALLSAIGLRHISRHTFDHLRHLRHLIVSRNQLSSFPSRLFWHLGRLEKLDISQNELEDLPENAFKHNANLTYLHLDMNKLTLLKKNHFNGLKNLEFLLLSSNQISQIEPGTFDSLKRVETLQISNNAIKDFIPFVSPGLSSLVELDLSKNKLGHNLPQQAFAFMQSLNLLNLEQNQFEEFDLNIIPAKLETLNLHKNYIANLTPNDEEKALKYLDLSGNNINVLPANVFSKLEHLEYLRLSNNMLKSLDFYKQLPVSLKKLDLRTNLMETLTEEDDKMMVNFGHLKLLEELFISQNLWICSCNFKVLLKSHGKLIKDGDNTDCQDLNGNYPKIIDVIHYMDC